MRWVSVASAAPHKCAAIPFVGSHDPQGFIDTGSMLPGFDPHVYVSVVAVKEMARLIGWVPERAPDTSKDRRVAELEAQVAELEAELNAVEVLKNGSFTQARRPGRPKKEVV